MAWRCLWRPLAVTVITGPTPPGVTSTWPETLTGPAARLTTSDTVFERLPAVTATGPALSPLYWADSACVPTPKAEVVNWATPWLSVPDFGVTLTVPNGVEPSKNVTVPGAGTPVPGWRTSRPLSVTVAVSVTACPPSAGLGTTLSTVTLGRTRSSRHSSRGRQRAGRGAGRGRFVLIGSGS